MAEEETQENTQEERVKVAPEGEVIHPDYRPEAEEGHEREGQIVPAELGDLVVADLTGEDAITRFRQTASERGIEPEEITEDDMKAVRGQVSEVVVDTRKPGSLETMARYKPSTLTGSFEKELLEAGDNADEVVRRMIGERRR